MADEEVPSLIEATPDDNSITGADVYSNPAAVLGADTPQLASRGHYRMRRLSNDINRLQTLYREHFVLTRVVDGVAEDCLKNWIKITGEIEPKQIDRFNKVLRKTATKAKLLEAYKWGRLFGGAIAVPIIKGQENCLDTPLDLDSIELGSYMGLMVFDRWSGVTPSDGMIQEDITVPGAEFGLPLYYECTQQNGGSFKVHCSRVMRFTGRTLPTWEKQTQMGWGISEIEHIEQAMEHLDFGNFSAAALMGRANIIALKQEGQEMLLATATKDQSQQLYKVMAAQSELLSNQRLFSLGVKEDLQQLTYSFAGLSDVLDHFILILCAAAEYPRSRLFGNVSALGSSGDGDEKIYDARVQRLQERDLGPVLDKLFPIIAASTWGEIPDDFDYVWQPYRTLDAKDLGELADKKCKPIYDGFNLGLYSARKALTALSLMSEELGGMFDFLTPEVIAAASDEVTMGGGELPGFGGESEQSKLEA